VKVGFTMVKVSNKVKASVLAATFGLFLATTSFATSANAAKVKNGVTCKKSGLKTKVGSKNYVCGKNPYITPTKLTWMLSTCRQAQSLLVQLKDAEELMLTQASIYGYKTLTELGTALGGQEQKDIDELAKGITDAESAMKNNLCKRGR
jgi:parvulin-like peptidyl-prolyl isomerase